MTTSRIREGDEAPEQSPRRRSEARSRAPQHRARPRAAATRRWECCRTTRPGLPHAGQWDAGAHDAHLARNAVDDHVEEAAPERPPHEREGPQRARRARSSSASVMRERLSVAGGRSRRRVTRAGIRAIRAAAVCCSASTSTTPSRARSAARSTRSSGRRHRVPHRHGLRAGVRPDEQARHRAPVLHQGHGPLAPAGLRVPRPLGHREVRHRREPGLPRAAPLPARAVHLHPAGDARGAQARPDQAQAVGIRVPACEAIAGSGARARPAHHLDRRRRGRAKSRSSTPTRSTPPSRALPSCSTVGRGAWCPRRVDRPDEASSGDRPRGRGPVDEFR